MLRVFFKEVAVFTAILAILAIFMHKGELPKRIEMAINTPSLFVHALIWASLAYMLIFLFRAVFRVIFMRKNERRESK